jgi:hypothetical protein
LAQDSGRWRAVVNTVMNLRFLAPLSWLYALYYYKSLIFQLIGEFPVCGSL